MTEYRLKGRGDCECCPNEDVEIYAGIGSTLLCNDCVTKEKNAASIAERSDAARQILNNSRVQDANVIIKADIHNAKTTAITELKEAIWNDDSIAPEEKQFAFAKECMARFENMQKAVFDARAELTARETEMRMWQIHTQSAAGQLRNDLRDQFKTHDVKYKPVTPKTVKPKATPTGNRKPAFSKTELYDACKTHGVDATVVRMVMLKRGMTAEVAAKFVAETMK